MPPRSIFEEYYVPQPIVDRYLDDGARGVDVIIPVIHTNELWRANLISIYREVPVHELIIADGGSIDGSIDVLCEFPRVRVLDHRAYRSLGMSLRLMIEAVATEWFIYLHSDVYLPPGWFDVMTQHQGEYDWFGSAMQHTILLEYPNDFGERPWAGSQMGRKKVFDAAIGTIDDDFVYRQEDFVLAEIVKRGGGREGRVADTFHYHQTILKPSPTARKIKSVKLDLEMSQKEEIRTWNTQARGIVKYLRPGSPWLEHELAVSVHRLIELGAVTAGEFEAWTSSTNAAWLPHLRSGLRRRKVRWLFTTAERAVKKLISSALHS